MTGVPRAVDKLGRLVIPAEIRRNLGFNPGEMVEFSLDVHGVVTMRAVSARERCSLCGRQGPRL